MNKYDGPDVSDAPTGVKFDDGKLRMDLIPPEAINALATILTYGAKKYAARNWEKGMNWSRAFAAAQRHLWLFWEGEDFDQESSELHLEHALCNLAFLVTYFTRDVGTDDRPSSVGDDSPPF